ncbi:hypothetical protein [Haladaptatus caseinilyticus]|uniref:hypothetical protein n=1 Tax=Haladaptatus caseinilyticus TaxID=2993314 RepID=UPI00224B5247|nr:hypothetical protein [Haladaptatus caseinilyticus]
MPSRYRRSFLGTLGVTLTGIAGCVGDTSVETDANAPAGTKSPTQTTSENAVPTDPSESFSLPDSSVKPVGDIRVAVADTVARKAVSYESVMGSGGVLASDGKQFVVAAVQSESDSSVDTEAVPPYDAFELVADGRTYPAVEIEQRTTGAYTTSLAERGNIRYGGSHAPNHEVGWVAFEPPSPLEVSNAAIRCRNGGETAEWRLTDEQVGKLARPAPTFEPRSFETTVRTASVEVSLVAENVSEVDGRFLAAVYWPTTGIADDDEATIVTRSVASGDHMEWSKSFGTMYSGGEDGTVAVRVEGTLTGETTVNLDARDEGT